MSVIAVVSMKGGVGKTSVTANLAAAMAARLGEGQVAALDLDPQNALHLHLGFEALQREGVCRQSLQHRYWRDVAFTSPFGVSCLPYGSVSEGERGAFENLLASEPDWVQRQLAHAGLGDDHVVLIDLPPGPSVYLDQGFACADLVLVVLLADAGSYSTIIAMESWINEATLQRPGLESVYLLNQVDEAVPLSRDLGAVLRRRLGARLLPIGIHRDEAVSEALAFLQPVLFYDPRCQASDDFQRLAACLLESTAP
ncbi:MAG: cellulose biosynthesis protein BcsQ [Rhodoferax sp.]|uniref:cellulose biosynthesis protein BcsQ n=1 Tax=Rhodoferax sp. TaxID=50421 RepID=UPI002604CE8B|nr:cellulose biosynthesis protein BcsQ [Rhodoferax sp.]MDD5332934.1 cellulose biosynthesis protein BcsQ [Rhodoferax sp.]